MIETARKKFMGAAAIIEAYKKGERDFSGVMCTNASLEGADLRNAIFRKSNLGFCSFRHADLRGTDFSEANLEWTNFTRADLRNANLQKARAVWSVFNEAVFEKTNMRNADLSWSLFFNTNLYGGADLTNAVTGTIATSPEQITEEGLKKLREQLGGLHDILDYELWLRLRFSAANTAQTAVKIKNLSQDLELQYGSPKMQYGPASQHKEHATTYSVKQPASYTAFSVYDTNRKKPRVEYK